MSDATTTADTPAVDAGKLAEWRAKPIDHLGMKNTVILHTLEVKKVANCGHLFDLAFEGRIDDNPIYTPLVEPPYNLTDHQVGYIHQALEMSLDAAGVPHADLPPGGLAAGTPVIVEDDTAPPPADPTDLDAWDAETARLVAEREGRVGALEAAWEDLHAEATLAKKAFEAERDKMRAFIRERRDQRGKPYSKPEPTLFDDDNSTDATADGAGPSEDRLFELSQLYPLDFAHWEEFGLTEKDIEKLNEGVTKHHGTIPLRTLGDVARYTKPSADGYERRLTDIKGFGPGAFERWEAANLAFWAAWPNGKAVKFAAEIGFDLGGQAVEGTQPAGGGGDAPAYGDTGGGDTEAGAATEPAAEQPPKRLKRNEKTGELESAGEDDAKRKRKKAA